LQDIGFLLEVEKEYCNKHKEDTSGSYKNKIRDEVRAKTGLKWSGYNTKSKLNRVEK
jgi:hypothetical protein